ncbi:hypothetical protein [Microbacterium hominis]|uniref:Uncharacterized protein n=1 Tax=Microbacterium hominis TaxID=162426 RepID=A0A7D4Q7E2_9MICO|nr:hypothetical protein [Microbacterium hominis]QKJ18939.1 hypothetical protein HQM25_05790 [Microbacterium hominis]
MTTDDDPDDPFVLSHDEMLPLIEVAHGARILQHMFEAMGPPLPTSYLGPDADGGRGLREMAEWCEGYLDAAIDHLVLWADYAVPLKFHPDARLTFALRPALTLARAAMESAAQTIWILAAPDSEATASRFFALGVADTIEHAKATPPGPSKDELLAERDRLCEARGVTAKTFRGPTYVEMVRYAAELWSDAGTGATVEAKSDLLATPESGPEPEDEPVPAYSGAHFTPDRVEMLWRASAGAAHGKQWVPREFGAMIADGGHRYRVPSRAAVLEVLKLAEKILTLGLVLYAQMSGREEEWYDLRQAGLVHVATNMTTHNGVPLRPEDVPDLRPEPEPR